MIEIALAVRPVTLRCASCSHAVGTAVVPMRLAGLFKASMVGKVPRSHSQEKRARCASCGWVNVFHPVQRAGEVIELK